MTDKQPEALRLAALIEKTGAKGSLRDEAAAELRRQHAELETLRAKLKTYEDLGDAGSDVQLLRMGYAAARLEIESLNAQLHAARGDAARYRLVRRGQHWSVINGIGNGLRAEELDAAVDAARKQGANHD
ncbi:MAG TPA: hypothetical protein DET46_06505 [Comamonadaceae bacterium]|nr:MAG: hypothetical protein A3F76_07560 [Burkholderiales bacterium RIFCSPLOWO2_12_FULL_65_40]HCE28448.1 hypothetical protein [Comamonadaceae bacterium]